MVGMKGDTMTTDPQATLSQAAETADWHDTPPVLRSTTRRNRYGAVTASRKVAADGTVLVMGRRFQPKSDVQTMPVPGEWLLVYQYDGYPDLLSEWTAPSDPDGFIRRLFWDAVRP